jgi:signal transduction histidine kinase
MWHKVFDPFFSTRGGLAIGLGLSFVDGVIAQHGGTLLLTSDVRVGTSLAIYLPRGSALAGPALPREE